MEPMLSQRQSAKKRRADGQRINGRAGIVNVTGQRQLRRSRAAADCRLGFIYATRPSGLHECNGGGETDWSRAADDGVESHAAREGLTIEWQLLHPMETAATQRK